MYLIMTACGRRMNSGEQSFRQSTAGSCQTRYAKQKSNEERNHESGYLADLRLYPERKTSQKGNDSQFQVIVEAQRASRVTLSMKHASIIHCNHTYNTLWVEDVCCQTEELVRLRDLCSYFVKQ